MCLSKAATGSTKRRCRFCGRCPQEELTYNVSYAIFGGTAPFVATYLIAATGNTLAPAIYRTVIAACADRNLHDPRNIETVPAYSRDNRAKGGRSSRLGSHERVRHGHNPSGGLFRFCPPNQPFRRGGYLQAGLKFPLHLASSGIGVPNTFSVRRRSSSAISRSLPNSSSRSLGISSRWNCSSACLNCLSASLRLA